MYIGHGLLWVCLSLAAFPHYCTYVDVSWRMVAVPSSCALLGRFAIGARFHCYDNIAPNAKCRQVLVLALCLVLICRAVIICTRHYFIAAIKVPYGRIFDCFWGIISVLCSIGDYHCHKVRCGNAVCGICAAGCATCVNDIRRCTFTGPITSNWY